MPVYEYRCGQCEKEFEYQQRMSEPAKTTCEECGGGLERLISRTAFQFKGGGWYKDLYASQKPAESKAAEAKPGDAKSDAKSDTKSDAKPDTKKSGGDSGASGGSGTSGGSSGSSGSSGPSTSSSSPAAA